MKHLFSIILFIHSLLAIAQKPSGCLLEVGITKASAQAENRLSVRSLGPYASAEECELKSKSLANTTEKIYTSKACKCNTTLTKRDSTQEAQYLDKVVNEPLANWYMGMMNNVSREKLSTLHTLFPQNSYFEAALTHFGTAAMQMDLTKGCVEIFDVSKNALLKEALAVLQVPEAKYAHFYRLAGAFILDDPANNVGSVFGKYGAKSELTPAKTSAYSPTNIPQNEQMNILLAQNAFLIASDLYAEMPSEKTAYISTALFGIAAIISAENGQKDLAKTLLENAINMLALTEDKGYQAEMGALFSQTNQSQQLQVSEKKLAPYQPQQQKTMPVAAQNGENNLSGTYKMIENNYPQNTSAHDGRIVFTNSDIFLTQNGNAIKYTAHSKIEVAPSSYSGASSSGSITNSETMATGQLLGNIVEMNVHTITNYSGTTVTYSLGVSVPPTTTPPGQTIYDSKLRLTFLPDGKMKITNDKDRYYSIYQKQ